MSLSINPHYLTHQDNQVATIINNQSSTNLIGSSNQLDVPIGFKVFKRYSNSSTPLARSRTLHKTLVLFLTFIAYAAYHVGRRPLSIVKNVLHRNCSELQYKNISTSDRFIQVLGSELNSTEDPSSDDWPSITSTDNSCNWAPFDGDNANQLLAIVDTAFLASYAICMFLSGYLAERTNLRHFLAIGCALSGLSLIASSLAKYLEIHTLDFFIYTQILSGAAQSTGWPVVVTCVGNWFAKSERGLIYVIWNSHTNIGNILGAIIAGLFVKTDWGLSFIVPGALMIAVAFVTFLFLVPSPKDIGLDKQDLRKNEDYNEGVDRSTSTSRGSSISDLESHQKRPKTNNDDTNGHQQEKAISFLGALMIPGVIEYALCLFFSKSVSYTFLCWLPKYIDATTSSDSKQSTFLPIWFDIGGVVGAIVAGILSDRRYGSGTICGLMLLAAMPSMHAFHKYGYQSITHEIILQSLVGAFVNGPYCLITTSVSADLGERVKDGHAMATVAAIIDGMGSLGAVVGPLLTGLISSSGDWSGVFHMLMISNALASVCLVRIVISEIRELCKSGRTLN